MCVESLAIVYKIHLAHGNARLKTLEDLLACYSCEPLSENDLRNEKKHFDRIYSDECKSLVNKLFESAINRLAKEPYCKEGEEISMLVFLQEISAKAMWKFHIKLVDSLEKFVREFDRLDMEEERRRLYEWSSGERR